MASFLKPPVFFFFLQMLKLLRISFRLIESWEFPSQTLSGAISNSLTVGNPNQITEKLADLKVGISVLIKVRETRFILRYSVFFIQRV